jgi:uncharacterized membrane protein/sporulation protein YlmC with PRC-barrel domain
MYIAAYVDVKCTDGMAGRTSATIIDPTTYRVTHIVVRQREAPQAERLVPIERVEEATEDLITLDCSRSELGTMPEFVVTTFRQVEVPGYAGAEIHRTHYMPHSETLDARQDRVPMGRMGLRQGADVRASDGRVGQVADLLIDAETGEVTHLVVRESHLWGDKELLLPITVISESLQGTVHLKLDQETLSSYLAIPARQRAGATDLELLTAVFSRVKAGDAALHAIKQQAGKGRLKYLSAAVLVKDREGRASIRETEDVDAGHGALFGAITGGLVGFLGGPIGVIVGAVAGAATGGAAARWIDMGFPDDYLSKLESNLQSGTSSIVLLAESAWAESLGEVLEDFGGDVLRQKITERMVAELAPKTEADAP